MIFFSFDNIVRTENDLSKMNIEQKREQLNFSYQWQRIDMVKKFIKEDNRDWKVNRSLICFFLISRI
jgi:hypothetical protein